MKVSDKYMKIVKWSNEDNCYIGMCPSVMYGGIHGDNEAKVYKELCEAVDEVLTLAKKDRRPLPKSDMKKYSGKFVIRIKPELHEMLDLNAKLRGISLNSYCNKIFSRAAR